MERAKQAQSYVLIEATANQVNQYGGYSGMTPSGFRDYVHTIAARVGFPQKYIILGGDHLGPHVQPSAGSGSDGGSQGTDPAVCGCGIC